MTVSRTATRRRLTNQQAAQPVTAVQVMPYHWHYGLLNLVRLVIGATLIIASAWMAFMMPTWADEATTQSADASEDMLFPLMEDRAPTRPAATARKAPSRGASQADQSAVFEQGDDEWLLNNPTKESPLSHTSGSRAPSNRNIQVVVHAQENKVPPPRRRVIHERGTLTLNRPWAQAENPVNWPGPQPLP